MSSLIRYFGGKHEMAPWICDIIDEWQFSCYVELFFGAGHVLFELLARRPTNRLRIIINDLSRVVYSFWRCVSHGKLNKKLCAKLEATPYGSDFLGCAARLKNKAELKAGKLSNRELVENAWALYVLCRQSFGGIIHINPGLSCIYKGDGGSSLSAFHNNQLNIVKYYDLIHHAQILNHDAFNLLGRLVKKESVLIYADPPYYTGDDGKNVSGYIINQLDFSWHKRLVELLSLCRGVVLLSYAENAEIDALISGIGGWERRVFVKNSTNSTHECGGSQTFYNDVLYVRGSKDKRVQLGLFD